MSDFVTRARVEEVAEGQFEATVAFDDGTGTSMVRPTFAEANDWMTEHINDYTVKRQAQVKQDADAKAASDAADDIAQQEKLRSTPGQAPDAEDTNHN
jgi:hypothetical protein